jgi:hypothetical protein
MSTEEVKSYTLEVPATRASIMELVREIFQDGEGIPNHSETRVKLAIGTNAIICCDEIERAEHRDNVKIVYALNVLRDAYYAVEEIREEGQE